MPSDEAVNGVGRLFRFITPTMVLISLFILGQILTQVNDLNVKMYHHQTNSEIHIPRSELESLRYTLNEMRRQIIKTIREGK